MISGISNAQIDANGHIIFADANFKAKLLQLGIDRDSSGGISFLEAINTNSLNISSSNISDVTQLSYFTYLQSLTCDNNQITTLNLAALTRLSALNCSNNQITSLNLSQSPQLYYVDCSKNILTSLNINGLVNLKNFFYNNNQLPNLDVSALTSIIRINCSGNGISSLNVSMLSTLQDLQCTDNLLTSMASFNLSGLNNLFYIDCSSNNIPTLSFANFPNLGNITANNCQATSITITNVPNLGVLDCNNNLLQNLDVSGCNKLNRIDCSFNQLTTIDVSNCFRLNELKCNNNLLTKIFAENGSILEMIYCSGNPNLTYICADEAQIADVINRNLAYGITGVNVNSYCFFTPGGSFNTITGTQIFDENNNGCDALDSTYAFMKTKLNNGTNQDITFTNPQGVFNFYTGIGNFTLSPDLENQSIFNISPANYNVNFTTTNNVSTNNFCLTANGVHPDLEIVISPRFAARPGLRTFYILTYKNKGNQTLSGNVNLTYDDAVLDFFTSNPSPNIVTISNLNWNYTNLKPFESRSIVVEFTASAPTSIPPLNDGDVLNFLATINPIANDDLPLDNSFAYNQTVVNSNDPNDITCLEGDSLLPSAIGEYLHYVVQFENTGTAEAINVVVKDIIDSNKYDISTLQVLNSSNNVRIDIKGNIVEFIFENINLAARIGNPPVGGHGDVLFKIKTRPYLEDGDSVLNKANIYFDYNFPIITNDATTTFATLSSQVFKIDESVSVSPNPTTSKININANNNVKSIELYDVKGRILKTNLNANSLDISGKTNGIYFLKITTEKGSKIEKVVKE